MVFITYFVHGTTLDNEQSVATGWLPGELSQLGIEQSKKLHDIVAKSRSFHTVICSDLKRAIQTANIVFENKILKDRRLREANYGDFNGKNHSLFKHRLQDFVDNPFPNGESYHDVETRMRELCNELKRKCDGKRVAILAHQAPQLALEVIANGKTWHQAINEDWRWTGDYRPGWAYTLH